MKVFSISSAAFVFALALAVAGAADYQSAIPYFNHLRRITIQAADRPSYIVVDQDLWAHARPDLADIRLYDGAAQVPYALREQRGSISTVEREARVLNLGSLNGHTEFDIDADAVPEYDHVRLRLDAKNFVASAQISGREELGARSGTALGTITLYDFTRENLGSNLLIKIRTTSYRFLHVRLSPGIRPVQVKGASVSDLQEEKAAWTNVGTCQSDAAPQPRNTQLICQFGASVPVDRIAFQVPAQQVNFRRAVLVRDSSGNEVARDDISRLRMIREGHEVISERLTVDLPAIRQNQLRVTVENGDDAALVLTAVTPLSIERRIYFDPQRRTSLKLYSGDDKLSPPSYDYAKFFHPDAAAVQARLGPGEPNPDYAGRPDDRPWSERHKGLLWVAMIVAIAALALLALRGFAGSQIKS